MAPGPQKSCQDLGSREGKGVGRVNECIDKHGWQGCEMFLLENTEFKFVYILTLESH